MESALPKLDIVRQVEYMRDVRGIKFNIVNEEQAAQFLSTSNYYFKIKAFEKNYSTYVVSPNTIATGLSGKYCDLEFAYLQELSTLDMYLREQVLFLALSVEHFLKVRLICDISENPREDGYTITDEFLKHQPTVRETIEQKKRNSYCENLINKYSDKFPAWALVEVLSFGDLINFADLYYSHFPNRSVKVGNLRIVKFLRNAAAHNNCLINNLSDNTGSSFSQNKDARTFVSKIDGLSNKTIAKKMGNRTIHDLVVLICTYCDIVTSDHSKKRKLESLQYLLENRFILHKDYFSSNMLLVSNYEFIKKVVDKALSMCI